MPPQRPPEKTHYSYKEMMQRLKRDRRSGDGGGASSRSESGSEGRETSSGSSQPARVEVVERPDGTQQVGEVRRRRRRRSHQPKKIKEERIRKIKRALLLGGIPLIALVIGSYFLMLSRIKSEGFRLAANEQISGLAGADVEFGRFSMRGLVLSSRKVKLYEVPGTLIRGGKASAPKATLSAGSLLTGDWKLGMVQTSNSLLRFGPAPASTADTATPSGDALAFSTRALAAGLGLDRRPNAVYAEGIHLGLSDFVWEGRGSDVAKFVDGASFSVGRPGTDPLDLILTGGDLNVPGWPEFEIGRISGKVSDGVVKIEETTNLEHGEDGRAILTGDIGIVGSGRYVLDAIYENIEARDLVHPFWKDSFAGQISGELNLSGSLLDPSTLAASGKFSARKLVVSNNRMFRALAHELGEALLGRVEFRSFEGRYKRDDKKTEFYDLVGEHPSLFRFRGQASAFVDGRLDGKFEIGIPETILDKIEGGKPDDFGEPIDGFCWTSVTVTGLIDNPREDLTEKLEIRRRVIEDEKRFGPKGGTKPEEAGEAFESLIKP